MWRPGQVLVAVGDVDSAGIGDPAVDQEQLAVVPQLKMPRRHEVERGKGANFEVRLLPEQQTAEIVRKVGFQAAEAVEDHLHIDAGAGALLQRAHKSAADFVAHQDIGLHADAVPRTGDILKHTRIGGDAVAQHFKAVAVEGRIVREQPVKRAVVRVVRDLRRRREFLQRVLQRGEFGPEIFSGVLLHAGLEFEHFLLGVLETHNAEQQIAHNAADRKQRDEQQPEKRFVRLLALGQQNMQGNTDVQQQKTAVNQPVVMSFAVIHDSPPPTVAS